MCRDLRPDMAVLDLSMPRLNGIDASHEIKRVARYKNHPSCAHPDGPAFFRVFVRGSRIRDEGPGCLQLAGSIAAVFRGEIYVRASGSRRCLHSFLAAAEGASLAKRLLRPRCVLKHFLRGKRARHHAGTRLERKAIRLALGAGAVIDRGSKRCRSMTRIFCLTLV